MEELEELKGVFNGLEQQKNAWEATDTELRNARAALDNDENATDNDKQEADQAIENHQSLKDVLIGQYMQA